MFSFNVQRESCRDGAYYSVGFFEELIQGLDLEGVRSRTKAWLVLTAEVVVLGSDIHRLPIKVVTLSVCIFTSLKLQLFFSIREIAHPRCHVSFRPVSFETGLFPLSAPATRLKYLSLTSNAPIKCSQWLCHVDRRSLCYCSIRE